MLTLPQVLTAVPQVRLVSLAIDVEKVNQFGPPQIDVYEDVEQQKQIFASDRPDLYNENLSHYIDYDKVGDFYLNINNVGFDDDSYRIRIRNPGRMEFEIPHQRNWDRTYRTGY